MYAYVGANPINKVDPKGLINPDELCSPNFHWDNGDCWPNNDPGGCPYGQFSDPMGVCGTTWSDGKKIEATETFGECTVKCVGWVTVGEAGTSTLFWALSKFAGKLAWEAGTKLIPIAGSLSTTFSGFSAVKCMWDCQECPTE